MSSQQGSNHSVPSTKPKRTTANALSTLSMTLEAMGSTETKHDAGKRFLRCSGSGWVTLCPAGPNTQFLLADTFEVGTGVL